MTIRRFYGWPLLVVFMFVFLANMAFPYFGAGVINAAMAKDLGLERTALGLAFTFLVLFSGLPGPLVALIMDRIGARKTVVLGASLVTMGCILIALLVSKAWLFIVLFGVVIGSGVCFATSIPAQTTITKWFAKRRALALSILWLSVGGGGAIAAPLLGQVIAHSGTWRSGWFLIAALAAISGIVAWFAIVNDPIDIGQVADGTAVTSETAQGQKIKRTYQTSDSWSLSTSLRTPAFWIITSCAIAFSLPLTVMFAHLVAYLKDLGHSPALAAGALGLIGLAQIGGKLSFGILGDRFEPRYLWAVAMGLMAVALLLALNASNQNYIYAFAILLGAGQGASLVAMPTLMGNYFGSKVFGKISGTQTPIITVSVAVGPWLVGMYYDYAHTYAPSFIVFAIGLMIGTVLLLFTRPPRLSTTGNVKEQL